MRNPKPRSAYAQSAEHMGAQEAALRVDLVRVEAEVAAAVHEHSAAAQDIARLGCSSVVAGDCELKMVRQEYYRAW